MPTIISPISSNFVAGKKKADKSIRRKQIVRGSLSKKKADKSIQRSRSLELSKESDKRKEAKENYKEKSCPVPYT